MCHMWMVVSCDAPTIGTDKLFNYHHADKHVTLYIRISVSLDFNVDLFSLLIWQQRQTKTHMKSSVSKEFVISIFYFNLNFSVHWSIFYTSFVKSNLYFEPVWSLLIQQQIKQMVLKCKTETSRYKQVSTAEHLQL